MKRVLEATWAWVLTLLAAGALSAVFILGMTLLYVLAVALTLPACVWSLGREVKKRQAWEREKDAAIRGS